MEALCAQAVYRDGVRQLILADCAALGQQNLYNAHMRREMSINGSYIEGTYPEIDFGYIHFNMILKGGEYQSLYNRTN
mgnify:FL=1